MSALAETASSHTTLLAVTRAILHPAEPVRGYQVTGGDGHGARFGTQARPAAVRAGLRDQEALDLLAVLGVAGVLGVAAQQSR